MFTYIYCIFSRQKYEIFLFILLCSAYILSETSVRQNLSSPSDFPHSVCPHSGQICPTIFVKINIFLSHYSILVIMNILSHYFSANEHFLSHYFSANEHFLSHYFSANEHFLSHYFSANEHFFVPLFQC